MLDGEHDFVSGRIRSGKFVDMSLMKSHSRAAVYCVRFTTSNVSVTTWARHPVVPPTMRKLDASIASVLRANKSVTVFGRRQAL